MRWDYSDLSLMMWLGLMLYVVVLGALFLAVLKKKNKRKSFNASAIVLVSLHLIFIVLLNFSSSVASSGKVGFEIWACGRQVDVAKGSNSAGTIISKDFARFGDDRELIINGDIASAKLKESFESAGLKIDQVGGGFGIPISKDFELKVSSGGTLPWLKDSIIYPNNSEPLLSIKSGSVVCPYGGSDEWNIFIARVDNKNLTYSWQRVEFSELAGIVTGASDGGDLPDCIVLDYDAKKTKPDHRCSYLLKNDSVRCPSEDKSVCKYRELSLD